MSAIRGVLFRMALVVCAVGPISVFAAGEELLGAQVYIGARRAMADSRWDDAVTDFQTLVTVGSPLADYARYWQGVCYLSQSRRSSAVDAFLSLSEQYPDSAARPHAWLALGDIYASTGAYDRAIDMYRAALAQVPTSIDTTYARYRLAATLAESGQKDQAYRELRLVESPGRTPPDFFGDLLALMRTSPEPEDWVRAAQWLYDIRDYAGAAADCERALASPDVPAELRRRATLLRGKSMAQAGRLEDAATLLHGAAAEFAGTVQGAQAMLSEATTRRKMRQTTEFVALIERLAAQYPNSRAAEMGVLTVAKAYDAWGKFENAQRWYARFAADYTWSSGLSDALYRRAVLAALNGADAVKLFQDVIEKSRSAEFRAAAHFWVGKLELARGNTHKAAALFSAAARLKPYSYYGMRARGALPHLTEPRLSGPAGALRPQEGLILLAPQPGIVIPHPTRTDDDRPKPPGFVRRLLRDNRTRERVAVASRLARAGLEEAEWELEALNARFGKRDAKWALAWILYDAGAHDRAIRLAETLEARQGATAVQVKLVYPLAFPSEVDSAAARFGVDKLLLEALMREESRFSADDVSSAGAVGLMQLMPDTARWVAEQVEPVEFTAERIAEPSVNIALGAWYIRHLLDRFDGNLVYAIAAYNAGPGNVDKWVRARDDKTRDVDAFIEAIPFEETRGYVKRVLRSYAAYTMLYR